MSLHLTESQLNHILNTKIGKVGTIKNNKEILYLDNADFFVNDEPDKENWLQIHSDKLVDKNKNSYLQYLLEQENLSEIPFKLLKITDMIDTNRTCYNASFDNVPYLTLSKIKTTTYQLYINFQNGTEYMINLHEDNKYFLILDRPDLINWYRIRVLETGKYIFYISRSYLNFMLQTHDANGRMDDILVSIIQKHQIQGNPMFDSLKNTSITTSNIPFQEDCPINDKFEEVLTEKMFEHQYDNIKWVMYIENLSSIDMTRLDYINTQGMIEIKLNREYFYTNHAYQNIYNKDSLTKTPRHEHISFRGGVLADEPGMGKTRSMLGVILTDLLYSDCITINGNLLNNSLPKYIRLNEKVTIDNNREDDIMLSSYNELINSNKYYLGQTLVIAPTHIVDIWQEEISEMTKYEIKYVALSNITHVKRMKVEMIKDYNLIIMSNSLINNKRYQDLITQIPEYDFRKYFWHRLIVDEASDIIRIDTNNYSLDNKTTLILNYLSDIDSLNRWCLTASPYQYKESNLGGYIKFLSQKNSKDVIYNLDNNDIKKLTKNYFRRHNKKGLQDLPIPKIKKESVLLKQSGIERAIYQFAIRKYNKVRLMQLCTHVQISEEETKILGSFAGHKILTLEEIENNMVKHFKNKIKDLQKETGELAKLDTLDKDLRNGLVNTINKQYFDDNDKNIKVTPDQMAKIIQKSSKVQYVYSLLDDYLNNYSIQKILSSLDDCNVNEIYTVLHINHEISVKHEDVYNNKIIDNEREITTLNNQMKLFKQNYISESVKEPCYICYDHYDKVIITECRHIFCGNCMKILFQNNKTHPCPVCRREIHKDTLKVTDIKLIQKAEYLQNLEDEDIKKYGTKIAFLIQKTRKLLEEKEHKIIIFSQWSSMLKLISNVLTEFKINHLTSKGNTTSIKANMSKFESNDIRVLLLNPDDCIIGNDLSIATHIIMTDVLMMSKNNAKIIENQLLGYFQRIGENKEITMIKLITSDTIEEEYWKKQK